MTENDGYTNAMILFKKLKNEMYEFFTRNHIENYNNLYAIIVYLFEEKYRVRRPYIFKIETECDINMINAVKYILKDKEYITMDDLKIAIKSIEVSDSTYQAIMDKFSDEIIEIDSNRYIIKDNI